MREQLSLRERLQTEQVLIRSFRERNPLESWSYGGRVAQLGEHLLCKQGVTGSIPVTSTNPWPTELRNSTRRKHLCISFVVVNSNTKPRRTIYRVEVVPSN